MMTPLIILKIINFFLIDHQYKTGHYFGQSNLIRLKIQNGLFFDYNYLPTLFYFPLSVKTNL